MEDMRIDYVSSYMKTYTCTWLQKFNHTTFYFDSSSAVKHSFSKKVCVMTPITTPNY